MDNKKMTSSSESTEPWRTQTVFDEWLQRIPHLIIKVK